MIRTWCKDHPIQFMACYLVFYLAFFKLLEQGIQVPDLVLHCRLDDLIPFCKYAIIPYYLWFAWIPCTLFYLLWFNDRREFWRLCLPLFTGMTLSLLFCAIVPNGTDLRPAYIYGNDIFTRAYALCGARIRPPTCSRPSMCSTPSRWRWLITTAHGCAAANGCGCAYLPICSAFPSFFPPCC
mgnify:FL=1